MASLSEVLCSLIVLDQEGNLTSKRRKISAKYDLLIGRDAGRCQWSFHDPYMSQEHLRIRIVTSQDNDQPSEPRVYAEDLSRNGVYWNGSLIGSKNNVFLLSDNDHLRLTSKTSLRFAAYARSSIQHFSLTQEREMREFCTKYVITDQLLSASPISRTFVAIDQSTRTQVVCEVFDLTSNDPDDLQITSTKRPIPAGKVGAQHELRAVKAWAMKTFSELSHEKKVVNCFRICQILHSVKHPNILGLEKAFITDDSIYMFADLVPTGNLRDYVQSRKGRLLDIEAALAVRQILNGLQALHSQNIVHRNIKSTTILVSGPVSTPRFVLSGFELARKILDVKQLNRSTDDGPSPGRSTFVEAMPETVLACGIFQDMRSVGTIAMLLLTGSDENADLLMSRADFSFDKQKTANFLNKYKHLHDEALDLVQQLCGIGPCCHPDKPSVFDHAWFSMFTHKADIAELCGLAVKRWRPALPTDPFIEFISYMSWRVQSYDCAKRVLRGNMPKRIKPDKKPVSPLYKPFYMKAYNLASARDNQEHSYRSKASAQLEDCRADWNLATSEAGSSCPPVSGSVRFDAQALVLSRASSQISLTISQVPATKPKLIRALSFRQSNLQVNVPVMKRSVMKATESISTHTSITSPSPNNSKRRRVSHTMSDDIIQQKTRMPITNFPVAARNTAQLRSNMHSSLNNRSSVWSLDARSQSKLKTPRKPSMNSTASVPTVLKQRGISDTRDQETLTAAIPSSAMPRAFEELVRDDCVIPHMAHLRLTPFD